MAKGSINIMKNASRLIVTFCLILIVVTAVIGAVLFFEGENPLIVLKDNPDFVGSSFEISFTVTDLKSGLRSVKALVKQDKKEKELYAGTYSRSGYTGKIGPAEEKRAILFEPPKSGFTDGPAEIVIEAHDYSLRGFLTGNVTILKKSITIDTQPPKIDLLHNERSIKPGGSGIVIYRLSEEAVSNGVQINTYFFPGFQVGEDKKDIYIAYFCLPYDTSTINVAQIVAKDRAGNRAVVSFNITLLKTVQKSDQISIDDGFLNAKLPEFQQHYPEMTGDSKDKYLYVNNIVRKDNDKKILALCQPPSPERLWQGRFLRMPGSPRAGYADHRTYVYKGEPFDKQVHLGVDIAQTERTEVKAANKGKVIFAEYLGIYGNTIILDHGQGIFSLYSHLSEFNTTLGEVATGGHVIARTGHTGMAGGDHLHFAILVHGIFVTPIEWWDPHWIEVTIDGPLKEVKTK
jgi:murein DD-endopeptidase MepM/ murein hydrolase activator NlpD